jgi:hypothetical protein
MSTLASRPLVVPNAPSGEETTASTPGDDAVARPLAARARPVTVVVSGSVEVPGSRAHVLVCTRRALD